MTNTATEFAQSDRAISERISCGFDGYRSIFREAVVRGQADGSVREDLDPDELAHYLVTHLSGLRTMVASGTEPAMLDKVVGLIKATIG